MGDRTSVTLILAGHIETVIALKAVCEAIEAENMSFDWDESCADADEVAVAIGEAVARGEKTLTFVVQEKNYGNLDEVEGACTEHNVAFSYAWDAGASYGAGCKAFTPDHGMSETTADGDSHATVELAALQKALKTNDPLAAVRELVSDAELASGEALPPLSISDAVKAFMASDVSLVDVPDDVPLEGGEG